MLAGDEDLKFEYAAKLWDDQGPGEAIAGGGFIR